MQMADSPQKQMATASPPSQPGDWSMAALMEATGLWVADVSFLASESAGCLDLELSLLPHPRLACSGAAKGELRIVLREDVSCEEEASRVFREHYDEACRGGLDQEGCQREGEGECKERENGEGHCRWIGDGEVSLLGGGGDATGAASSFDALPSGMALRATPLGLHNREPPASSVDAGERMPGCSFGAWHPSKQGGNRGLEQSQQQWQERSGQEGQQQQQQPRPPRSSRPGPIESQHRQEQKQEQKQQQQLKHQQEQQQKQEQEQHRPRTATPVYLAGCQRRIVDHEPIKQALKGRGMAGQGTPIPPVSDRGAGRANEQGSREAGGKQGQRKGKSLVERGQTGADNRLWISDISIVPDDASDGVRFAMQMVPAGGGESAATSAQGDARGDAGKEKAPHGRPAAEAQERQEEEQSQGSIVRSFTPDEVECVFEEDCEPGHTGVFYLRAQDWAISPAQDHVAMTCAGGPPHWLRMLPLNRSKTCGSRSMKHQQRPQSNRTPVEVPVEGAVGFPCSSSSSSSPGSNIWSSVATPATPNSTVALGLLASSARSPFWDGFKGPYPEDDGHGEGEAHMAHHLWRPFEDVDEADFKSCKSSSFAGSPLPCGSRASVDYLDAPQGFGSGTGSPAVGARSEWGSEGRVGEVLPLDIENRDYEVRERRKRSVRRSVRKSDALKNDMYVLFQGETG